MAEAKIEIILSNGSKAGDTLKELTKNANRLNKEIKDLKPGTEEFTAKASDLQKVGGRMDEIKQQIKGTSAASDSLKKTFGGVLNQIPGFSQLSGVLGQAKGGVGGLTSGFGLLRGAIISTGIGALVIAITSLVTWFSKTEKGANMLSGAFKAMGAVVDTLMSKLWNIGDTLNQLFNDPIEFFKNLGKDIANAAVEGYEFVQIMDDIEDRQRDMEVTAKENEILVDQLLLQAKNVGKTYEERLALLNKANDITKKTYQEQLALSKEYLNAVEKEVAAEMRNQGVTEMTGDQADRIKEAKLAYLNILGQEIETEEKIANRKEQILGKQAKDTKKAEDEKKEIKVESARETAVEVEKVEVESEEKRRQRLLAEQTYTNDLLLANQMTELNEQLLAGDIQRAEYQELATQKALDHQARQLEIIKAAHGEQSAEYVKAKNQYLQLQQSQADQAVAIRQQEMKDQQAALIGSLGTFGNFFSTLASFQQQGTSQWKAFATASAIMSTIQGAINAYTSTSAIPIVGPALAPIAAGLALAAGYANVRKIQSTKVEAPVKKAEQGGFLIGKRHSQGGIPIEAEGGEFIFSRKAVRGIGVERLSRINNHYNRKFATGGPVSIAPNTSPAVPMGNEVEDLRNMITGLIEAQDRRMDRIRVINVVTDTEEGIKTVNQIRDDADV